MSIFETFLKLFFGLSFKMRAIHTFWFSGINLRSFNTLSAKFGLQIVQHVAQDLK